MKQITLYEAAYAIRLLPEILQYNEPVGELNQRSLKKIESCLQAPFIHHGRTYKYWYLYERAAALFYFLIKSHALENGNKRSAVVITMAFLIKNGKWLNMSPDRLYDVACEVAESPAHKSSSEIAALSVTFKNAIRTL